MIFSEFTIFDRLYSIRKKQTLLSGIYLHLAFLILKDTDTFYKTSLHALSKICTRTSKISER